MVSMKKNWLASLFCLIILGLGYQPVFAGGGPYSLVNFENNDIIRGLSYEFVLQVHDYSTFPSPPLAGKNFRFEPHHDLAGANCQTTQGVSDSNGYIKARCQADQTGRFVFNVISEDGLGNTELTVYFTKNSPLPSPIASPTIKPNPIVKTISPTVPLKSASPSALPTVSPTIMPSTEPSPVMSPSPTPVDTQVEAKKSNNVIINLWLQVKEKFLGLFKF